MSDAAVCQRPSPQALASMEENLRHKLMPDQMEFLNAYPETLRINNEEEAMQFLDGLGAIAADYDRKKWAESFDEFHRLMEKWMGWEIDKHMHIERYG